MAGAAGGWLDGLLMRITDAFLALPGPILAIAVVAALGPSLSHTLLAVMIVWWPFYARIVRGEIRALASRPHIEAARLSGAGRVRIALRHLLPGAIPATLVIASLDVDTVVPGHGPVTTPAYLATQRAVLLEWTSAVANAVAAGWSREETVARVDFRDKFGPVDVGQGYMMDHIQTLNAASLWDKFTAKRAPVR